MKLSLEKKDQLRAWVKRNVWHKQSHANFETLLQAAAATAFSRIVTEYPQDDMRVLNKYDVADNVCELDLHDKDGRVAHFDIAPVLMPKYGWGGRTRAYYKNDVMFADLTHALRVTKNERDTLAEAKREPYFRCIASCQTTAQLAHFWPEVKTIFPNWFEKRCVALVTISPADIAKIEEDVRERNQ